MKAITLMVFAFCYGYGYGQQKPVSEDYIKTNITENGHKDSIIDNKPRLYNASISEPCLKCVIQAIKRTDQLKPYLQSADSSKLVYEIDWYPSSNVPVKSKKQGSGLLINVYKNLPKMRQTLAAYIYDNAAGQLSYINDRNGNQHQPVLLGSLDRVKIRNACFWGVPSAK